MVRMEFIVQLGTVEINRCGDQKQHFRHNHATWLFY